MEELKPCPFCGAGVSEVGRDEASALAAWNLRWLPVFDADRVAAEADNKPPPSFRAARHSSLGRSD